MNKPRALSLHIGSNLFAEGTYPEFSDQPSLWQAAVDSQNWLDFARGLGYETTLRAGPDANTETLKAEISSAADRLKDGGLFLLTTAGHGAHIRYPDGAYSGWAMYDRILLYGELGPLFALFSSDCKVVNVIDCCYSGSAAGAVRTSPIFKPMHPLDIQSQALSTILNADGNKFTPRALDSRVEGTEYERLKGVYDQIRGDLRARADIRPAAAILTLAASRYDQESYLMDKGFYGGVFTYCARRTLDDAAQSGKRLTYAQLYSGAVSLLQKQFPSVARVQQFTMTAVGPPDASEALLEAPAFCALHGPDMSRSVEE